MIKRFVLGVVLCLMAVGCVGCATDAGVHVGRQSKFIDRGPGASPGFSKELDQPMTVGVVSVDF